jgi:hypothetical protein
MIHTFLTCIYIGKLFFICVTKLNTKKIGFPEFLYFESPIQRSGEMQQINFLFGIPRVAGALAEALPPKRKSPPTFGELTILLEKVL